jgi:hypothetical protein
MESAFLSRLRDARSALDVAVVDGEQFVETQAAAAASLRVQLSAALAEGLARASEVSGLRSEVAVLRAEQGANGESRRAFAGAAEAAAAEMESELWGIAALLEEKERCVGGSRGRSA